MTLGFGLDAIMTWNGMGATCYNFHHLGSLQHMSKHEDKKHTKHFVLNIEIGQIIEI